MKALQKKIYRSDASHIFCKKEKLVWKMLAVLKDKKLGFFLFDSYTKSSFSAMQIF